MRPPLRLIKDDGPDGIAYRPALPSRAILKWFVATVAGLGMTAFALGLWFLWL
jgi:hypothetical protein